MPQPRHNPERPQTPAEKQAAYRQRQEGKADRLRALLWRLEAAVWTAADAGDGLADGVKAGNVETLLANLAAHFEQINAEKDTEE